MKLWNKVISKGSPGLSKLSIIIIVVIIVAAIFVVSKFGPHYQAMWKFEDWMEETLGRLATLGEDGVLADLEKYCQRPDVNIPCDPWTQCKIYGEPGKAGRIVCTYTVEIKFPLIKKPYILKMTAVGKRTRIPLSSN